MNVEVFHLHPPAGFVFCVAVCVGKKPRTLDVQIGFCSGVIIVRETVFCQGAFRRWDDALMERTRAEPADFGGLALAKVRFEFVKITSWMRRSIPPFNSV